VDLGELDHRHKEVRRAELTLRNVGHAELRFRVRVSGLDDSRGQRAVVEQQPHGLIAPGLRVFL